MEKWTFPQPSDIRYHLSRTNQNDYYAIKKGPRPLHTQGTRAFIASAVPPKLALLYAPTQKPDNGRPRPYLLNENRSVQSLNGVFPCNCL